MTSAPSPRIKLLYIAGVNRSGSTVLCNLLGQIDGFFSCGELYNLYRTPPDQRYCGCGALVSQCEVWDAILRRTLGEGYIARTEEMLALRNAVARSRYAPLWATPLWRGRMVEKARAYLKLTGLLYQNIAEVTQSRVIVDSSKVSSYAHVLAHVPSIDLRLVFLVRDARAVAYSWQRKRLKPSPQGQIYIRPASPIRAALDWVGHNLAIEVLIRSTQMPSLRIQYEQFAKSPRQVVERILAFSDETVPPPDIRDNRVDIKVNHTVEGNPDRFRTGPVELKPDDEWQSQMKPRDRAITTLLTWPLLLRYGYRL